MKRSLLIYLFTFMTLITYSNGRMIQGGGNGTAEPIFNADVNGRTYSSISSYMARFVKYPEGTDSFGLIGTAVVGFVVSTTGEVTDIQMINSLSYASDQEVISVLKKTSGNWSPAVVNGKVVSMKREVSVVFKPNKNYDLTKIALKSKEKAEEKLQSNDPKKAIKYYDRAIMVLPYEQSFFAARGLCKYETGDIEGARADWERINYLNKYDSSVFNYKPAHIDPNFKSLKGYDQLCQSLN